MAVAIPNLWPQDIHVDVLPPLVILKAQIQPLEQMTKGLLRVEVSTRTVSLHPEFRNPLDLGRKSEEFSDDSSTTVFHDMDVIAPTLRNYRHTLLTVDYQQNRVYPARLSSKLNQEGIEADSAEDFMARLGEVLKSSETRSLLDSLLARINEQLSGVS
jgi:hypothetical protein